MKKTFAMIAAAFSSLTACVVEDRVIIHDSHPRPYYQYARPYYVPAPSYWYAPRHHGHHRHGYRGWGHGHYRW